MSLKSLYKQIIPRALRENIAGLPWVARWRNRQYVREGHRLADIARQRRTHRGKIHVAFIVQRQALWPNHASIYEAMKGDPLFAVSVIAIPKRPPAAADVDLDEYRRLQLFLNEKKIPFFPGYDLEHRTWINPLAFGLPDLIFLPQPYAFTQSYLYHANYLRHFCELAILNYGVTIANMPYMQYELPVYADCRFIFVESEAHQKLFVQHAPSLAERLYVTGHPKLDFYRTPIRPMCSLWKMDFAQKKIIWAPHFTVANDRTPHTFSTFFEYYELFVKMARKHPEIEFVMRPHPDLFNHMVATGLKTAKEAQMYHDSFQALPNGQVYDGGDIFTMFQQSDALILDSIGFLAEYAPTGKPICFLESTRRQKLNPIGEALLNSYYKAWNGNDIQHFVDHVVIAGKDDRREERLEVVQRYVYMPPDGAGFRIRQTIRNKIVK